MTHEFLGRSFAAVGDRYQCDRCSRTFETLIGAAECDGPNHSQIRGHVSRRKYFDYAIKACGGRRLGEEDPLPPEPPKKKGVRKSKYATEHDRWVARRAQHRAHKARVRERKRQERMKQLTKTTT